MSSSFFTQHPLIAAVDLGSNSFRLEIARYENGQLLRIDYIKEPVRQGGDLDEDSNLSPAAMERGVKCLARFGERLKGFPKTHVRAVATQTLREAKNRNDFLAMARKALGYRVEVISGLEEARLIYQGVSHLLPQSNERRLVIDVGGRSTELIIGEQFKLNHAHSMHLGSVAWSLKYFGNDAVSQKDFDRAEIAAISVLDAITHQYSRANWDTAYGASGTVGAVIDIMAAYQFSDTYVDRKGLAWLRKKLIETKYISQFDIVGLRDDRKAVICGGVAILNALLELLDIDQLHVATGALRHGLLFDMIAHEMHQDRDMRKASVEHVMQRYQVDIAQANHVREAALTCFDCIIAHIDADSADQDAMRQMLAWAAQLHEIGGIISYIDMNSHGAYMLENTEMTGFAQHELHLLGQLVLGQTGKLKKVEAEFADPLFVIALCSLRLATIFCHARTKPDLSHIQFKLKRQSISLSTKQDWLESHPQTAYLLEEEALFWGKTEWLFNYIS